MEVSLVLQVFSCSPKYWPCTNFDLMTQAGNQHVAAGTERFMRILLKSALKCVRLDKLSFQRINNSY